jgi:predicted nucleotidyltransferase
MKETISKIIREELKERGYVVKKIILFGSRARNEAKEDSDWDVYVVIDKEISFSEVCKISGKIQLKLAEVGLSVDIIIRSDEQFEKNKSITGYISYYANKEGVLI